MEYVSIPKRSLEAVRSGLLTAEADSEIINYVLSAVYYFDEIEAGDILLTELRKASGKLRIGLLRSVEAFIEIHRTDHLINEFQIELSMPPKGYEDEAEEILRSTKELQTLLKETHV